jgi:hypothetical protein
MGGDGVGPPVVKDVWQEAVEVLLSNGGDAKVCCGAVDMVCLQPCTLYLRGVRFRLIMMLQKLPVAGSMCCTVANVYPSAFVAVAACL